MDGELQTKRKTCHYTLIGTRIRSDAKKPLIDEVVGSDDWDDEMSGIKISLQSGEVLHCVAPNMVEYTTWRRALEVAVNPKGAEAKALKKELRKAKKAQQQEQEDADKKQQDRDVYDNQNADSLRAEEEKKILDEDAEAEKQRKADKVREVTILPSFLHALTPRCAPFRQGDAKSKRAIGKKVGCEKETARPINQVRLFRPHLEVIMRLHKQRQQHQQQRHQKQKQQHLW